MIGDSTWRGNIILQNFELLSICKIVVTYPTGQKFPLDFRFSYFVDDKFAKFIIVFLEIFQW